MAESPRYFGFATSSVDAKNRITIPAKFRSKLPVGHEGRTFVYVMMGPDFRHLAVYDLASGQRRIDELTGDTGIPGEVQRKRQQYLALVEEVEVDKQGRVLLPKEHVEYARLKGEVVVSGAGDHIEVYDPEEGRHVSAPVSIEKLDPQHVSAIFDGTMPKGA